MRSFSRSILAAALLASVGTAASAQVGAPVVQDPPPGMMMAPPPGAFGYIPPTGSVGTATGALPDPSIAANAGGSAPQGHGANDPNYIPGISPPGHASTTGTGAA